MTPFVLSYPIWVIHFTPLRVLEGLLRLRIGGEATTPSIQFDTWSWGGSELRVEPTIWGEWWGLGPIEVTGVAGYFPSVAGFYYYLVILILHLVFLFQNTGRFPTYFSLSFGYM